MGGGRSAALTDTGCIKPESSTRAQANENALERVRYRQVAWQLDRGIVWTELHGTVAIDFDRG